MQKQKLGIIVGRFQTPKFTEGHKLLFQHVANQVDSMAVFVGVGPTKLTVNNPLPYAAVADMLCEHLRTYYSGPKICTSTVAPIADCKTDAEWSQQLDELISLRFEDELDYEITLYGGRDSFIKTYTGKYKTMAVDLGIDHISATSIRKQIHEETINSVEFRSGIIYASGNKYPISYQAVDIVPWRIYKRATQLLLAKKKGEYNYRFIGGFVDPADASLESAAIRELYEECKGPDWIDSSITYIGSKRIDDWRYRNELDKILTTLFSIKANDHNSSNISPADDIEHLQWIYLHELIAMHFEPEHQPLFEMITKNEKFNQQIRSAEDIANSKKINYI